MAENYVGNAPGQVLLQPLAASGRLVQTQSHLRGDYFGPAGVVLPFDDTIPQITEGVEYFSIPGYAPLAVGNRIRVRSVANISAPAVTVISSALFRSDAPGALAVGAVVNPAVDYEVQVGIDYEFIATSVTPLNYTVRLGGSNPTMLRMNGRGSRIFGGFYNSFLRIDEYSA